MIDAACPETNEVATLYLLHTSEGVLPFWKKISPNAFPAPLLALQHALVGRTHGLPRNALGVCECYSGALDTLLMHHVSLGVIWIVTKRPSELLGLNQKHVGCCTSVVPRVPDAAVTVLLTPGRSSTARRVPVGVVGVITPWNFPIVLAMRSIGPALALGNTIVLKPDLDTPVSGGVLIARIFEEAGLPAGVMHVIPGGPEVGAALTKDPLVRMISFTGSTATGRLVGAAAGRTLKRVVLELGGNSPLVVLDDADVDAAASAGAWGSFLHQGQICLAVSRHLVHERIAERYLDALTTRAKRLPVGNPDTDEVALGPIINERQVARVQRIVDETVSAGAEALTGGKADGLFYPPTVLAGVTPEMAAFREEIFGPVAPVITFSSDDEAVALANQTEYGLSAAVQSASASRATRIGARIHAGMVHINDQTVNEEPPAPFGGFGVSSNGGHFGGVANLELWTEWQWVTVRDQASPFPF